MTAATYHCEVQPPTPILCHGTFSEYAQQQPAENSSCASASSSTTSAVANNNQQQQQYLCAKQQQLAREASSNGSSWDMTNEDTLSNSNSSSSGGNSHTHDPYGMNRSYNNSQTNLYPAQYDDQQQQHDNQQQQYCAQQEQYPQYHCDQQQQQPYPVYNGNARAPANVPPSLQLASQSRRRQENEDLFPAEEQSQYPYPAQQGFVAHSNEQQPQQQQQQQQSRSAPSSKPFPECCYHKALVNRMEFIQPPVVREAGNFAPNTRSTNYLRVFIGQCRFESTPAELRWLVHYLTNVQPVKVELRGTGCFMAYVQNYEEVYALLNLKEKLLFDHTGVWFARDEEQASFLRRYVHSYVAGIGKGFRLPKDMVVLHDQQQVQQQQRNNKNGYQNRNQSHHHQGGQQHYSQQRSSVNNFYASQQQQQYAGGYQ